MQLTPLGASTVAVTGTGELRLRSHFSSIMTPNRSCLALMEYTPALAGGGGASGGGWKALVGASLLGRARICRMPPQGNTHYQVRYGEGRCGRE